MTGGKTTLFFLSFYFLKRLNFYAMKDRLTKNSWVSKQGVKAPHSTRKADSKHCLRKWVPLLVYPDTWAIHSFWEWPDMEKNRDVTDIANSGSGQMHQLQGVESLFNAWSLWLTKACTAEAMKCTEHEMDIFKQTEKSQLCEPRFLELRTCQTQTRFPEIRRNTIAWIPRQFHRSGQLSCTAAATWTPTAEIQLHQRKRGPEVRGELQLCLLLHHRPWDASAPPPNKPGQSHCSTWQGNWEDKHDALRWQDRESQGQTDTKALQRRTGKEWTQWYKSTSDRPHLLPVVPRAIMRFHSLFTLPLGCTEPPKQSTADTQRRFLAMGRVLTTVPAPTKDFKW